MDTIWISLLLLVLAGILGVVDRYEIQRTYADVYAEAHGHIPPLVEWFFERDADPEVDRWRRYHRNMYALVTALAVAAIVLLLVRAPTPG
jgi:uncharacterized Tic20 family protein